jgi:hypothetical protein
MKSDKLMIALCVTAVGAAVFFLGRLSGIAAVETGKATRVFEIRTYTTEEGKLDALLARFRDHTCGLFEKHGMSNIGYWVPADEPKAKNTLIYVISHESREAATKNWDAFRNDPEWKKVAADSEANGKILSKPPESVYANPTDFSPIK